MACQRQIAWCRPRQDSSLLSPSSLILLPLASGTLTVGVILTASKLVLAFFFSEELAIEFEPCDGDNVTTVSTEHNADLALQHDLTKWMSCFQKECRNLCRLSTQLVKCQNLQASGHKTVEVRGVGQVNLDAQIEEVKQQIRKCAISKCKARARLTALKEGGMPVEDLTSLETRIKAEMKQVSLDVDTSAQALSRTSSMKSTNVNENHDGRGSAMESKSL